MSVTIYHKKSGTNNSPVNVSITDIYATMGQVSLNESWSYHYNSNGLKKTGRQTCSLIITSATNNISMVQSILMKGLNSSNVSTTIISNMLILSNLNNNEYSSFNLPVGSYTIILVPEQVKPSDIGLSISDQKPDSSLSEFNFSSLKINYSIEVVDNSGASTNPNGPTVTFNSTYGKDRIVFIRDSMSANKFKPSGSDHSNNIYSVNTDAILLSSEHKMFRNENGKLIEQTEDVSQPGHYYSKYILTDKYGIKKDLGFNVFVFKINKDRDLNLVGNMTSIHMAIYRKNVSDFVSTGDVSKYLPKFKDSQGNFNSEIVLFADSENQCQISVDSSFVVIEDPPLVNVANLYIEESINKKFTDDASTKISLSDVLTNTGISMSSKYGLTFENGKSKQSINFDDSVKVEGNNQKYNIGYNGSSFKTVVYLSNDSSSPSISLKETISADILNQSSLTELRKGDFDRFFEVSSDFGIGDKSISFGEVSYSSGKISMAIEGKVNDSFGNSSTAVSSIILNNKQNLNFNVSMNGTTSYPNIALDNIKLSGVSPDVFSSVSGYPSPDVTVELGSQKMTGVNTSSGIKYKSGSITLTEADLTKLFTGKTLSMKVSMSGSTKTINMSQANVSVSGIVPKVNSYTGKTTMEAISFNNTTSFSIDQVIFKNISDSVGIKSISLTDSNGKSISLGNSSGNSLSLNNDKSIDELRMSTNFSSDGNHTFTLRVVNLVGGETVKTFSIEIVNINKKIVEKSAWGFVKYSNPTDGNMELIVLERTGSSPIDMNNSSTFRKVHSDVLAPGKNMIRCLPNRITLSVTNNKVTEINNCGDVEIWALVGSISHKLNSFYSQELRPSVIC
jgi:hypothetical protein